MTRTVDKKFTFERGSLWFGGLCIGSAIRRSMVQIPGSEVWKNFQFIFSFKTSRKSVQIYCVPKESMQAGHVWIEPAHAEKGISM